MTPKNVNFLSLSLQAEALWGYAAPKQEHLENRIKGRHKAEKEGRPPPAWVTEACE